MERFHLYAGLGGGFGGAHYCETVEAENIDKACKFAYDLAVEEYQSYEGYHGIMDWDDCYEDAAESGVINEDTMTEREINKYIDDMYQEQIENWIEYYAIKDEGQDPEDY